EVRQTVYEELLWLANHTMSWWHDPRAPRHSSVVELEDEARLAYIRESTEWAARAALAYLALAEKTPAPTHSFYELRADCHQALRHAEEAEKDRELAKKPPPVTVGDYYFQSLAAAQKGDLDAAVQALSDGLRLDAAHFPSLMLR